MKRIVVSALSAFLVAALLGLTGCEGGGVETGMPDTAAKPDIPLDGKANMAAGETPPPGTANKAKAKGTETGAPAEKVKDAPKQ